MDLKQIERLMQAMKLAQIKRLALKQEGFEIELERDCGGRVTLSSPQERVYEERRLESPPLVEPVHSFPVAPSPSSESKSKVVGTAITSPMVGTFYTSPSPDAANFVKVGDVVTEESVVCIIEAMKVMNEVKAGVKGRVVEILVKNGDPVEFGTKIFSVEA